MKDMFFSVKEQKADSFVKCFLLAWVRDRNGSSQVSLRGVGDVKILLTAVIKREDEIVLT